MTRASRPLLLPTMAIVGTLAAVAARATTIIPLADDRLVDRAGVVAAVTVEAKLPVVGERPETRWQVVVDRVLKGTIDTGRIVLRLPGGERADGVGLHIYGTPKLQQGSQAILFLHDREDGTYGIADFPQGAFLAARSSRRTLALRDFSEVRVIDAGRVGTREPMRDFDLFANWIEDRAEGFRRAADYVVQPRRSELESIAEPFTTLSGSGVEIRWFAFDNGNSVTWYSHTTLMPGLSSGGINEMKKGLTVWTGEPTTPVKLVYGGTRGAGGGFASFDGFNVVLWTDLNNDIDGSFDCGVGGGTLAIGGPWYDTGIKGTFNGKTFLKAQGADIAFNDGVDCKQFSSPNFSKFIEEVVAHELGHTLGLGHSSEKPQESNSILRQALMYFRANDDGRGANLNSDDVGGLQYLYKKGGSSGGGGTKPPKSGCPAGTAPDTLCLLNGRFHVFGTWQNQFDGSSGAIKPIPNSDLSGFFYFTDPSNVELIVKILDFQTEFKVFYSQLTNLKFTLTVRDTVTGQTKNYSNTAGECGAIDQNFASAMSSQVQGLLDGATAAATGTCSPSSGTLCTLDRRFAITVDWRNQFNGASGTGLAKSLSSLTGAFAFDDPANLEILIKTLDFGDKILVIYGSLSNFEYTIHVTDTLTGQTKDYRNAAGNFCGGLDDNAF